jgi:Zn-dependent protease
VDRERLLSPRLPEAPSTGDPAADGAQAPTRRQGWRDGLRRVFGPLAFLGGLALKLGSLAKFAAIFIAFGGYTLIWGWEFALGVILLIFIHEMGHFAEAAREHLHPSWPVFIPFLGAYVKFTRGSPWQTARVALAGPALGGLAALGCFLIGESHGWHVFIALGYFGFVLNLLNLLPLGILDGGAVWRSTRWLWQGGGRDKALVAGTMYATTALLLAVGAFAAYVPQNRL